MEISVFTEEITNPVFDIFEMTRDVPQMEIHHPEGDVFNHSLQVMNIAFKESQDVNLILAAMLHDVGKIIESKGHERHGCKMLNGLVNIKILWLIENHMRFWYWIKGDMRKLSKAQELAYHPWLSDLACLARWDKMGRNPNRKMKFDRGKIIEKLNKYASFHFRRE